MLLRNRNSQALNRICPLQPPTLGVVRSLRPHVGTVKRLGTPKAKAGGECVAEHFPIKVSLGFQGIAGLIGLLQLLGFCGWQKLAGCIRVSGVSRPGSGLS